MSNDLKNIAILASGSGSNAQSLMEKARMLEDQVKIKLLISDNQDAFALERARKLGVDAYSIPFNRRSNKKYEDDKLIHESHILERLREYQVDWVLLAGYMRILSVEFLSHFYDPKLSQNRVVNIHPSLLPKYPGKDGYGDAFKAGEIESGVTVHFVDGGVDTGRIIKQSRFKREKTDDLESFKKRGLEVEHKLYPEVLEMIANDTFYRGKNDL